MCVCRPICVQMCICRPIWVQMSVYRPIWVQTCVCRPMCVQKGVCRPICVQMGASYSYAPKPWNLNPNLYNRNPKSPHKEVHRLTTTCVYIYVYEEGRGKRKHHRKPKKVPREKNRNKTNPPEDTRGHQSAEQTNKWINANLMNIRYSNNGTRKEKHKHENAL